MSSLTCGRLLPLLVSEGFCAFGNELALWQEAGVEVQRVLDYPDSLQTCGPEVTFWGHLPARFDKATNVPSNLPKCASIDGIGLVRHGTIRPDAQMWRLDQVGAWIETERQSHGEAVRDRPIVAPGKTRPPVEQRAPYRVLSPGET